MKFIILGVAGRMGSLHRRHLVELGHSVVLIDPKTPEFEGIDSWPGMEADGIVIATPAEQHAADINTVLSAGLVKHIFVEKPICLIKQRPGMRKMLIDARVAGVTIHVGYNLRFHRSIKRLVQARRSQEFKNIISAVFMLRQVPQRPIANFLEEWASHEVDLALYLFGRENVMTCLFDYKPDSPSMQLVLKHRNAGVVSFIYADGYYAPSVRTITLVDELGMHHHVDIERTHVQESDYKDEILKWVAEISGEAHVVPAMLATGRDGLAAIDLLFY